MGHKKCKIEKKIQFCPSFVKPVYLVSTMTGALFLKVLELQLNSKYMGIRLLHDREKAGIYSVSFFHNFSMLLKKESVSGPV